MALLLHPGLAWGADVLLLSPGDGPGAQVVADALLGTGLLDAVEQRVDPATPSAGDLLGSTVVLLWGSEPWSDPAGVGDVLVDWLQGGGALVVVAPSLGGVSAPGGALPALLPATPPSLGAVSGDVDPATLAAHPALAGLGAPSFADVGQGVPGLAPGAELLASGTGGDPVLLGTCDRSVLVLNIDPADALTDDATFELLARTLLATDLRAAPRADAGGPYAVGEGEALNLSSAATAPGDLGGVVLAWDLDGDGAFDDSAATAPIVGPFDGPASLSLALRATDRCGRLHEATTTVDVTNLPPAFTSLRLPSSTVLGVPASADAPAADPGSDALTWAWDWGEGTSSDTGPTSSWLWTTPGPRVATVEVSDGDGGSASASWTVDVRNPGPTIALVSSSDAPEGSPVSVVVAAAAFQGEPVQLSWDWGDGTVDVGSEPGRQHSYGDDGARTLLVTATDTFGAQATLVVSLIVDNIAPSITTVPPGSATEGQVYAVPLTRSDPADANDPPQWSLLAAPVGATLDGASGQLRWTPTLGQALVGSADFTVGVSDGDGGTDQLPWAVPVNWIDADADGLPDTWEQAAGLDPTQDDADADADGDGWTNAQEWAAGRDPLLSGVPGEPWAARPVPGATVDGATPELSVSEAADPDGDPLLYAFEVWDHPGGVLLQATAGVAPSAGEASWTIPAPLPENGTVHWRARASDGVADGPWTPFAALSVDAVDEPPSAPEPQWPRETTLDHRSPLLTAGPSSDPEGQVLSAVFRIYDAAGLLQTLPAEPTSSGWQAVADPLFEDATFRWTAEARDPTGQSSGESDPAVFWVDATNQPPLVPLFLSPAGGAWIADARPTVSLQVEADPDGEPVEVELHVARGPDFGADREELWASGAGPHDFELAADRAENETTWMRARTHDARGAVSPWTLRSFAVDVVPEAPPTPVFTEAPSDLLGGGYGEVRWAAVVDPEGAPVLYELRIRDERSDEPFWEQDALGAGVEGSAITPDLGPGAWRLDIRATDGALSSAWSAPLRGVVAPPGGEGFDTTPDEGCGASLTGRSSLAWWALLLLALRSAAGPRSGGRRPRRRAR